MNHIDYSNKPLWFIKSKHIIYYILGVIEVLLLFRFIFKVLGANVRSGFVEFIYTITGILTAPFSGIFYSSSTNGLAARSVFEPATLIGMTVYAIIAWGLINLMKIKLTKENR